jgi:hypothetical protein
MTSSNHAFTLDRAVIAQAVLAGEDQRKDRIEQEAHDREMELRRQIAEAPRRAAEILSGLPDAIAHVVGVANETPQSFVVMWVQPHEYEGNVERDMGLGFRGPHQGLPESLKLAARQVYDALANLQPELIYKSKGEPLSGKGQLAIVIRLS